jgi:hypothetical protein
MHGCGGVDNETAYLAAAIGTAFAEAYRAKNPEVDVEKDPAPDKLRKAIKKHPFFARARTEASGGDSAAQSKAARDNHVALSDGHSIWNAPASLDDLLGFVAEATAKGAVADGAVAAAEALLGKKKDPYSLVVVALVRNSAVSGRGEGFLHMKDPFLEGIWGGTSQGPNDPNGPKWLQSAPPEGMEM